jgi:tetratricopeptide (TPR) repeat protein
MASLNDLVRQLLVGVAEGWDYGMMRNWLRKVGATEAELAEGLRLLVEQENPWQSLEGLAALNRGELAAVAQGLLAGGGAIGMDYQELVDRADQFFAKELYTEAIEYYRLAIKIKEDDYNSWKQIGRSLLYENDEEALKSFDKSIELKSDFHEAWYGRGHALCGMGRYEEALKSFDKSIELKPDFHKAWNCRGYALLNLKRYEKALESFDKLIELKPDFHEAWYGRGHALNGMGRYEEALESSDKSIELKPDFHEAWYGRGYALNGMEMYQEALAIFDQLIELDPNFRDYWDGRGHALNGTGRYEEALEIFDQLIELDPNHYSTWNGRGNALNGMGRYKEALESHNKSIELQSDYHYVTWDGHGNALNGMGRYKEALESHNKSIELQSDYYYAWNNRGNALNSMGRYEEALESLNKAIELKPDNHLCWYNRSGVIGILYDPEAQIASYQDALKHIKSNTHPVGCGFLHHQIGLTYYQESRQRPNDSYNYANQAIKSYHKALQTLTAEIFPQERLPVLIDLAKAHLLGRDRENTDDIATARKYQTAALTLWRKILGQQTHPGAVKRLYSQYSYLLRTQVDLAILAHDPETAIVIAELHKNHYLKWFLLAQSQPDQTTHLILDQLEQLQQQTLSLKYETMRQLLAPQRGIIYWHLSNDTLTTFILHPQRLDPIVLATSARPCLDWLQAYDSQDLSNANWPQLKKILQISEIDPHLTGLTDLILVPHRDLHRLPLHSYWPTLNITYLPSIQTGLTLQSKPSGLAKSAPENHLLLFKLPTYHNYSAAHEASDSSRDTKSDQTPQPLKNAEIELAILAHQWQCSLMPQGNSAKVTCDALTNSLAQPYRYAHFSGHAYHDANQPSDSYLTLDDGQKFVCTDFQQVNLSNYDLISLSACETGITRSMIEQDYVGLVSACLSRGTSYVLSTLWPIADLPSSLFMLFFYNQIQQGTAPPIALRQTAQWLRLLTPADIAEYYGDLAQRLSIGSIRARVESLQRRGIPSDLDLPFQDPQYWAAFTLSGVAAADL